MKPDLTFFVAVILYNRIAYAGPFDNGKYIPGRYYNRGEFSDGKYHPSNEGKYDPALNVKGRYTYIYRQFIDGKYEYVHHDGPMGPGNVKYIDVEDIKKYRHFEGPRGPDGTFGPNGSGGHAGTGEESVLSAGIQDETFEGTDNSIYSDSESKLKETVLENEDMNERKTTEICGYSDGTTNEELISTTEAATDAPVTAKLILDEIRSPTNIPPVLYGEPKYPTTLEADPRHAVSDSVLSNIHLSGINIQDEEGASVKIGFSEAASTTANTYSYGNPVLLSRHLAAPLESRIQPASTEMENESSGPIFLVSENITDSPTEYKHTFLDKKNETTKLNDTILDLSNNISAETKSPAIAVDSNNEFSTLNVPVAIPHDVAEKPNSNCTVKKAKKPSIEVALIFLRIISDV